MAVKKQLALTLTSLAIGAAMIGGGTFAYFNSTVSSQGNTFATGTIDISGTNYSDAPFVITNAQPGATFTGTYHIKNSGSLKADLKATLSYTAETPIDLGNVLYVDSATFNGVAVTLPDPNGDHITTIAELNGETLTLTNEISDNMSTAQDFVVTGHFYNNPNAAQNEYQDKKLGGNAGAVFNFEARQK